MADATIPMVEEFCCPGCVVGGDTKCGSYEPAGFGGGCTSHVAGTFMMPGGPFTNERD